MAAALAVLLGPPLHEGWLPVDSVAALDAINDLCPFDDEPLVTPAQQMRLVALATGSDGTISRRGVLVAAREGWRIKAGRSVGMFDFSSDGQQFRRSQFADHIESRIKALDRLIQQSAPLG